MKLKQRVLTLLLTVAMLVTFMPALAFAGNPSWEIAYFDETIPYGSNTTQVYAYVDGTTAPALEAGWSNRTESGWTAVTYSTCSKDEDGDYYTESKPLSEGTYRVYFREKNNTSIYKYEEITVRKLTWGLVGGDEEEVEFSGSPVTLSVSLKGTYSGPSFKWFQLIDIDKEKSIGTGQTCTVTEEGTYYCRVTVGDDEIEKYFYVGVEGSSDDELDFGDLPDDLSNLEDITLGAKKDVSVTSSDPIKTFKFTPSVSAVYVFESFGGSTGVDPQGCVRTEDEIIEQMDDIDLDTDDENHHFQIIFRGEAGTTYYLQAKSCEDVEASFKVAVSEYSESWVARSVSDYYGYDGTEPVTLQVEIIGDDSNLTYDWYKSNGQLIEQDGDTDQEVSAEGNYYCLVSDGTRTERVDFAVELDLPPVVQGAFEFFAIDSGTCYVDALWGGEGENYECKAKGSVSIPSRVSGFVDGKARAVTCIRYFSSAKALTSVTIPSSVSVIEEDAFLDAGLKSVSIPASVKTIEDHALGYNYVDTGRKDGEDISMFEYRKVAGFTIFGTTGTAAQAYAKANGFTFRDLAAEKAAAAARAAKQAKYTPGKAKLSKAKKGSKKVEVTWKTIKKNVTGYNVQIVNKKTGAVVVNKNIKQTKKLAKKKTIKKVFKSGKLKKGSFVVKVRAYRTAEGENWYGAWSNNKTVKMK